jgi:hypothetical protein
MRDVLEFWIQLHSHPEMEISFKFIPKILMSKECIHFFGPLCIYVCVCVCVCVCIYTHTHTYTQDSAADRQQHRKPEAESAVERTPDHEH